MANPRDVPPTPRRPPAATAIGPVFISHSSKDAALAAAVVKELESSGIRCWISSRDIRPGEPNYGPAILEGLSACRAMVLLLTESSNASQHVMKESERAVNKNIPILVVRLHPVELSEDLEYYVSSAQSLDATAAPAERHFAFIRDCVREMLVHPRKRRRAWRSPATRHGDVREVLLWLFGTLGILAALTFSALTLSGFVSIRPPSRTDHAGDKPVEHAPAAEDRRIAPAPAATAAEARAEAKSPPWVGTIADGANRSTKMARDFLGRITAKTFPGDRGRISTDAIPPDFPRQSLRVSTVGKLERRIVSVDAVELRATFRIEPDMESYSPTAARLIDHLAKACTTQGTIVSDGMRTSQRNGGDARPAIDALMRSALSEEHGFLRVFVNEEDRERVRRGVADENNRSATLASLFLIHDEQASAENYVSGVSTLTEEWDDLLAAEGTGIAVVLESAKESFQQTRWRWFHLRPADWQSVSTRLPRPFQCRITLETSSGAAVADGDIPLSGYGARLLEIAGSRVLTIAPFYVSPHLAWYVPEVTLTESVTLPSRDAVGVERFSATIDQAGEE